MLHVRVVPCGSEVDVPQGTTLMDALRAVTQVDSPCGGSGKCGKCRCEIEDPAPRTVLACQHRLTSDTTVVHLQAPAPASQNSSQHPAMPSSGDLVLCIDIGTTTLAASVFSLPMNTPSFQTNVLSINETHSKSESMQPLFTFALQNPQTKYGADVMTRISYCREKGDTAVAELRTCLMDALSASPLRSCIRRVTRVVATGNPTMLHIFLGVSPAPLGVFPFSPAVQDAVTTRAQDVGLERWFEPDTTVCTFPIVGGHVGGDLVASALVAGMESVPSGEVWTVLDIGTNCEVAVGDSTRILACSCPTGPALEGAEISCGMRATTGAINTVRIGPGPLFDTTCTLIDSNDNGSADGGETCKAAGICGSGLIDAIAELLDSGALAPSGAWSEALKSAETPHFVKKTKRTGDFVLVGGSESQTGSPITISTKDVRAVQLAKAALHAGVSILLEKFGVAAPTRVFIAGAFGCNLDVQRAMRIGMLPSCPPERVHLLGNAALEGAVLCATNMDPAASLARRIEHVEFARDAGFQDAFVAAMKF